MPTLPSEDQIISVSRFTQQLKMLLEPNFDSVWIRGEISNLRRQASGHLYFSIKDAGSQVSCVLFRGQANKLEFSPKDGMQIIAFGRISIYEPRGNYQLILHSIQEDGVGRLQREFEELKARLQGEGLFSIEKKKSLPQLPKKIAFVTSPTGAALQDFISILRRREWKGELVVVPARVQGKEASKEIAAGIEKINQLAGYDLIVCGRGGGSLEDLWPFNEEIVVRSIANSSIPVISAVGHEIDFALSDFAADKRAETPSAAAELITSGFVEVKERTKRVSIRLEELVKKRLLEDSNRLAFYSLKLSKNSPQSKIEKYWMRLDDLSNQLSNNFKNSFKSKEERLQKNKHRFEQSAPDQKIEMLDQKIQHLKKRLENTHWDKTLQRGFVMIKDENGKILPEKKGLKKGMRLVSHFKDGELDIEVSQGQLKLF